MSAIDETNTKLHIRGMAERDDNFIDGLTLGGYRSFGATAQRMAPLRKINLFIGRNNSGKSNVLKFVHEHLGKAAKHVLNTKAAYNLDDLDIHQGDKNVPFTFGVGRRVDATQYAQLRAEIPGRNEILRKEFDSVLATQTLCLGTECVWRDCVVPQAAGRTLDERPDLSQQLMAEVNDPQLLFRVARSLAATSATRTPQECATLILDVIDPLRTVVPRVAFVPAIRRVTAEEAAGNDYSGAGLIKRLAHLARPKLHREADKRRFESLRQFLREVTGHPSAQLEIPQEADELYVALDGYTRPLESFGHGVHEVVILAAAATAHDNELVCIEEPEIHLHPILQRKLLAYLQEKTTNQYFIATHSAHILDAGIASVFHVRLENGETRVNHAEIAAERHRICVELGYRASDILQSNCVIWVEGPSDRIYLVHWIEAVAPELIESIHYSVMFYGGKLLKHLAVDEPEVQEFILLRRLNRNLAVVMDSDRSKRTEDPNETKQRICSEFEQDNGFAWVTAGREIENYIPCKLRQAAIDAVIGPGRLTVTKGRFVHGLPAVYSPSKSRPYIDKVKVAREVTKQRADLSMLDLKEQIERVVRFIKACND